MGRRGGRGQKLEESKWNIGRLVSSLVKNVLVCKNVINGKFAQKLETFLTSKRAGILIAGTDWKSATSSNNFCRLMFGLPPPLINT